LPDGTEVRDHRTPQEAVPAAQDAAPSAPPKVLPRLVLDVRFAVAPVVRHCVQTYAADLGKDPQAKPHIKVVVDTMVRGGVLSIKETRLELTNVQAGQVDTCIVEGLRHLSVPAGATEDVDQHTLTFPFDL
jgi:hypothetical protein